jgi:hypothetical protein
MRKDLIHMKMLTSLFLLVMPAIAAASGAADEPSMWEAVVPFAVIGVMLAVLGPLVARKKK